jgi:hypothetical protein
VLPILLIFTAAGCSRPPSAETFTAEPLTSSFAVLRSSNGQRQVLLVRAGSRWHGHLDDTFAATVRVVVADADDGALLDTVHPTDPAEPPVEIVGWRSTRDAPPVVVEAWAAGDPALRASGPSSLVSMLQVAGDSPSIAAVNAALAAAFEGAVGLVSPPGDTLENPGAIAARVAVEAAIQAVVDEDSGEVNPGARVAVLQIPVLLNRRFLAVEHLLFEDSGADDGGAGSSRFTLHDLETGDSPDIDATLDAATRANLLAIAEVNATTADWYPARPGIALVYRDAQGSEVRRVVPWRAVLPLLPEDSPLRAVAESVH